MPKTLSSDFIQRKAAVMSRALEELVPTYECRDGENPIFGCGELPSEEEVLQFLTLLDDVFYPGHRSRWARDETISTLIVERLDEAYDILYRQVKRALPFRLESKYPHLRDGSLDYRDDDALAVEAETVAGAFFSRLPHIREMLKLDVVAAYYGDPAAFSYSEVILSYPGLRAITTHRI